MQNPFKLFFYSFYEPKTYPLSVRQPFLPILLYTFGWYAIFALILASWFTLTRFPTLKENLISALYSLQTTYPKNLILTLDQSHLSLTGAVEPISMALPSKSALAKTNMLIINSKESANNFSFADTLFFISANAFGLNLPNTPEPLIIPYNQLNLNGSFESAQAVSLIGNLINGINSVSPLTLTLALSLFLLIAFLPARLIYALFTSLILSLFSSLDHTTIKFITYSKLTLVTLATAEAINLATTILYGKPTPMVFTLAFLGYTTVGVFTLIKVQKQTKTV